MGIAFGPRRRRSVCWQRAGTITECHTFPVSPSCRVTCVLPAGRVVDAF